MHKNQAETGGFLGGSVFFLGDSDPRAPHMRALEWIWQHAGLTDVVLATDERAIVLIDLAEGSASLGVVDAGSGDERRVTHVRGGDLGEVLGAASALAALYPPGQIPTYFDLVGDLRCIVAFMSSAAERELIENLWRIREHHRTTPERR